MNNFGQKLVAILQQDQDEYAKLDLSFPDELTKREKEVLKLLRLGKRNKEIAKELCLSRLTVQIHVHNILQKLGVKSRTEAAVYMLYASSHQPHFKSNNE
jgi:DNA-binding NarL/FixJ family response regulator